VSGFESPYPPAVSQVGRNEWELTCDMTYRDGERVIVVPAGQRTDWASVPPPLRWALSPMTGAAAALLHDHLYRVLVKAGEMTYQEADRILWDALQLLEVDRFTCDSMWASVRMAGLARGRAGREGWSHDALAVLAIMLPVTALVAVPTLVALPFAALIALIKRVG